MRDEDIRSRAAIERDVEHLDGMIVVVTGVQRLLTRVAATESTRLSIKLASDLRAAMTATQNDLDALAKSIGV